MCITHAIYLFYIQVTCLFYIYLYPSTVLILSDSTHLFYVYPSPLHHSITHSVPSIYTSIHGSIHLSACLSIYSICLSIDLPSTTYCQSVSRNATKWMCGVQPHVRIRQEDFGLCVVCLGSGGLFVCLFVCLGVCRRRGCGGGICNRDDDWLESGLYYKSENKGLISVDRSNKATLLLTIPRSSI